MKNTEIAYCKIFPPIGIARVGDSNNPIENEGWFVAPEFENDERPQNFSYKDTDGKIKRQGAKFRLFAFDKNDNPIKEITSDDAEITWTVELANKKAAWFKFEGSKAAINAFRAEIEGIPSGIRNSKHGSIELSDDKSKYIPTKERSEHLEINGGVKSISGKSINNGFEFYGNFKRNYSVYLGELKTDLDGHLIVLGGHGVSDAVNEKASNKEDNGVDFKTKRWIRNYANNDDWFDDISDGPVNAKVILKGGKTIEVKDGAWIIVAPPDFAPDVKNIVTLYDVMEEVAINNNLINKTTPEISPDEIVSFSSDIKPVLERMHSQRWLNERALKGHGSGKSGDFQIGNDSSKLDIDLSNIASERGKQIRSKIFSAIREPFYTTIINNKVVDRYLDNPVAIKQANASFMPPLAGDEGDPIAGDPTTWLSLTNRQYNKFKNWAANNFSDLPINNEPNLKERIDSLTKNVLVNCAGGAFYPGIEITCISRDPKLYCEAFRFNHNILSAGDISKYMALPWQADFWECQQHWWPAQRPDDVILDEEFESIFKTFTQDAGDNYEKVLFNREKWHRGIGRKSRPSIDYLKSRVLPKIEPTITAKEYIEMLSTGNVASVKNVKFDSFISIFRRIINIGLYLDVTKENIDLHTPSPWRLQYIFQEAIDNYSGLYFQITIPSPYEVFDRDFMAKDEGKYKMGFSTLTLDEIKRDWQYYCAEQPENIAMLLSTYTSIVDKAIIDYIKQSLINCLTHDEDLKNLLDLLLNSSVTKIESQNSNTEIDFNSDAFYKLRAVEMVQNAIEYLYLFSCEWSGDMDMVSDWKKLGFVRKEIIEFNGKKNTIFLEKNRSKYDGNSFRDYFYYLMNIHEFQDFTPYSKQIVFELLASTQELIDEIGIFDPKHPESYIPYSKEGFESKLDEIYNILEVQASTSQGWRTDKNKEDWKQRAIDTAVFGQMDGTWLRFIAKTGPADKIRSLLFEIWSDEIGNGNPALNHGNLFTHCLANFGIYLPPINSRSYADNEQIDEWYFINPVFQLAISQHTEDFIPELLGMTLYLEWEVLGLVPRIKGRQYIGIDTQFYEMHVGIDNASNGHGAKAKEAIILFLENVLRESGHDAQQEEWKRIWRGFVAFASLGYGYFGNKGITLESSLKDVNLKRKHKPNVEEMIIDLISKKAKYGGLNHGSKNIGNHRINDLFDEPSMFVEQLSKSSHILIGNPEESKLINYLISSDGPMYKVFNEDEINLWKEWIRWLGKDGDTDTPKKYHNKAESMYILLQELGEVAKGAHGHQMYKMNTNSKNGKENRISISDFFIGGDLKDLMRALRDPQNGWVVPFNPAKSPIVIDFARGNRPMGMALDRRFAKLNNQIGRVVLIKWIDAGCPLVGEEQDSILEGKKVSDWDGKRLLVQQIGLGDIH